MTFIFAGTGKTKQEAERDALRQAVDNGITSLRLLGSHQRDSRVWYVEIDGRDAK